MAKYYSKETGGFYDDRLKEDYDKNGSWPSDTVHIPDDLYDELLSGYGNGKIIIANGDGYPMLSDPQPMSLEDRVSIAENTKSSLMNDVSIKISTLQDAVDMDIATDEEIEMLTKLKRYRVLLNRVDTSVDADISWPEMPI
ncbi:tail fiber assembly protein [Escherichia coli]